MWILLLAKAIKYDFKVVIISESVLLSYFYISSYTILNALS